MASIIYNSFKADIMSGNIDLDTDTIKVLLVTSSYTPNAAHAKLSSITNEVASGSGYTTGGKVIANKTVALVGSNGVFDGDDVTWTSSTITARGAVLYKSRGGAASADELLAYIDFTTDKSSSDGNFSIQWNASGILQIS